MSQPVVRQLPDLLGSTQALLAQHGKAVEVGRAQQQVAFDAQRQQLEQTVSDLMQRITGLETQGLVAAARTQALQRENAFLREQLSLVGQMFHEKNTRDRIEYSALYHSVVDFPLSINEFLQPFEKLPVLRYDCCCFTECSPPFDGSRVLGAPRCDARAYCRRPEALTEEYNKELAMYRIQKAYEELKKAQGYIVET